MLPNGSWNKFVGPTTLMEYSIINSIAKFSYIIPVTSVWPVRVGSAIKRIKINKRSTLKSDALNALIIILINGPKYGTNGASYLIKQTLRSFGERKRVMQKIFCIIKKRNVHANIGLGDSNWNLTCRIRVSNKQTFGYHHIKCIASNLMNMSESSGTNSDGD